MPTDAEWLAAAHAEAARYPWGDTGAVCRRAAWGLFSGPCANGADGPDSVGAHPSGSTIDGVHDLGGNVSEWVFDVHAPYDAAAVTPADIVAFKDHRLAEGISPKTVGDSDIAGLRSVFDWMVVNRKLPANPAKDIKVTRPKVTRIRDKGFSPEEAAAILAHSRGHQRGGREVAQTFEAKRWVPWLCA